jgi:hypothetical protein
MLRDFLHLAVSMNTLPHKCVIPGEDQESTGLAIQGDSWIPRLRQE